MVLKKKNLFQLNSPWDVEPNIQTKFKLDEIVFVCVCFVLLSSPGASIEKTKSSAASSPGSQML